MGRLYREDHEGERHLLRENVEREEALAVTAQLDAAGARLDDMSQEEIERLPRETYLGAYDTAVFVDDDGREYQMYDGQTEEMT